MTVIVPLFSLKVCVLEKRGLTIYKTMCSIDDRDEQGKRAKLQKKRGGYQPPYQTNYEDSNNV